MDFIDENSFEEVLRELNELNEKGIITSYAIGGGLATIFYTEPFFTEDVDVFVLVPHEREESLDVLSDIYAHLRKKGYSERGLYVEIKNTLVQFLPASNPPLSREAVENANEIVFGQTSMRILSAEYLIAVMLSVGRTKDFLRMNQILEQAVDLNKNKLDDILIRHQLMDKWATFEKNRQ